MYTTCSKMTCTLLQLSKSIQQACRDSCHTGGMHLCHWIHCGIGLARVLLHVHSISLFLACNGLQQSSMHYLDDHCCPTIYISSLPA